MKKLLLSAATFMTLLSSAQETEPASNGKIFAIANAGYAWRVAEKPANDHTGFRKHVDALSSGFNYDLNLYYRLGNSTALGLKYNQFNSSATTTVTLPDGNGGLATGTLNSKDQIYFIGPSILVQDFDNQSPHRFFYDMAIGYMGYKDVSNNVEIKGGNLGLVADVAYHYAFNQHFSVGPQLGFSIATLKKLKIDGQELTLEEGSYEGLGKVILSLGAAYRF